MFVCWCVLLGVTPLSPPVCTRMDVANKPTFEGRQPFHPCWEQSASQLYLPSTTTTTTDSNNSNTSNRSSATLVTSARPQTWCKQAVWRHRPHRLCPPPLLITTYQCSQHWLKTVASVQNIYVDWQHPFLLETTQHLCRPLKPYFH